MAIQMNYISTSLGVTILNAYWRINPKKGIIGGKDEMYYILEVYKDSKTAHEIDSKPLDKVIKKFIPDLKSNKNFIEQAYNHIKFMPQFNESVDI